MKTRGCQDLARYRWHPNFLDDYAKLRSRVNREYGERAYGDKVRIETSGMLKDPEPDYELHFKPYKPQTEEHRAFSLELPEPMQPVEQSENTKKLLNENKPDPLESKLLEEEQSKEPLEVQRKQRMNQPGSDYSSDY